MTRDEALVLLRSEQMSVNRYIQLCHENGWLLRAQLLNEAGNALDDKDAEIERLRALIAGKGIKWAAPETEEERALVKLHDQAYEAGQKDADERLRATIEFANKVVDAKNATIADLTGALEPFANQPPMYLEEWVGYIDKHCDIAKAVLDKAGASLLPTPGRKMG